MPTVRYTTVDGEIIAEKRNGVRRLYVPDPLGSTVALLDNTQTQVDTATYWPYGEVRTFTGTTPVPFQFVGTLGYYSDGYLTQTVGRTYVRARYLHTVKARWLTQDPIWYQGWDANLYRYVLDNSENFVDPSGMQSPPQHLPKPPHGHLPPGKQSPPVLPAPPNLPLPPPGHVIPGKPFCPQPLPKPNCSSNRAICYAKGGAITAACIAATGILTTAAIAVCNLDPEPLTKTACIQSVLTWTRIRLGVCIAVGLAWFADCDAMYKRCVKNGGTP